VTTCPRCYSSLSGAHVTERGLICPHCNNPLGDVRLDLSAPAVDPDVTSDPVPMPDVRAIGRRLAGTTGRVIGGLFASAVLVLTILVVSAVVGIGGEALMGVLCFASLLYAVLGLMAVAWYLEEWSHSREWASEAGTTILLFLLLLGVIAGIPMLCL